ncbi:MAG: hypothetical protein HYX34_13720 [Actinobacteria bacterium]|nr:hypothetical protein [Actinomycetota bacterium]
MTDFDPTDVDPDGLGDEPVDPELGAVTDGPGVPEDEREVPQEGDVLEGPTPDV